MNISESKAAAVDVVAVFSRNIKYIRLRFEIYNRASVDSGRLAYSNSDPRQSIGS